MHKAFFIVGPTAAGKSELAVEVAELTGAEIVNVDAFQIYEGLDILTAKPEAALLRRVPHHLIGVLPLSERNDAARFVRMAQAALRSLAERNCPVVIVGGSGLYLRALTSGFSPLPNARPDVRAELEGQSITELVQRLRELDALTLDRIDAHNKRRLVRAVEICLVSGRKLSDVIKDAPPADLVPAQFCPLWEGGLPGVVINRERGELHRRIEHRVDEMFACGIVDEVKALREKQISPTAAQAIGLREIMAFLQGQISEAECRDRIVVATRQYAKRQITWFKKNSARFTAITMGADQTVGDLARLLLAGQNSQSAQLNQREGDSLALAR